jgi:hypothetical protein
MKTYEEKYKLEYFISSVIILIMGLIGLFFSYRSELYNTIISSIIFVVGVISLIRVLSSKLKIPKKGDNKEDEKNLNRTLKLSGIVIVVISVLYYYKLYTLNLFVATCMGLTMAIIYLSYVKNYRNI